MIGFILRWLPPVLLASVPLLRWGEDFRYSRFVIMLIAAALTVVLRPRRQTPRSALALMAAAPVLAVIAWAIDGFNMLGFMATAEIFAAMLTVWALAYDRQPSDFGYPWILVVTAASVYGILQALGVFSMPFDAYGQADPASFFGLSNFAAEALVVSIPLSLLLLTITKNEKLRILLPAAVLLQTGYLFLTQTRAGWVGITAVFVVALLFWRPADRGLYRAVAALAFVFVAGYTIFGWQRLNLLSSADPSLEFRRESWKAALSMAADKPLAGHGPGRFPSFVAEYSSERLAALSLKVRRSVHHPHNEFLATLAERGLPSLLWLLLGLGAAGFHFYRRRAIWALAGLAGIVVIAAVGFPFQQAFFWAGFALLAGLAAEHKRKGEAALDGGTPRVAALPLRIAAGIVMVGLAFPFVVRAGASDLSRRGIAALEASRRVSNEKGEILRARAAENLRQSLALWPYDPEAMLNAAASAAFPDQRVDFLRKYLAAVPGDMLAHVTLAQAQEEAGKPADAEYTLQALLLRRNTPSHAYHVLIGLLVRNNRFEEATRIASEALQNFENDAQLLIDAGDANRLNENYQKAVEFYEKALAHTQNEPGLYLRLGISQLALKNYPAAEIAFQKGHELAPQEAVYLVYLARLAHASDRRADARANLLLALKYDPDLTNNLQGSAPELLPLLQEFK